MIRNDLETLMQAKYKLNGSLLNELDKIRGNAPRIKILYNTESKLLEVKCKIEHKYLIVDETTFELLEKYNNLQMPRELPAKAITQPESTATMTYPGSWPPPKMKFPGLK